MTTPNTDTDTSLAASTSQHGSDASFDDVPPQGTADIRLNLVGSASLDSVIGTPPQAEPSPSKVPVPDANSASGSKRKQEDRHSGSDSEVQTHDRKKPKQERSSSHLTPRHTPDIAGVEGLVNVCNIDALLAGTPADFQHSMNPRDLNHSILMMG